MISISMNKIVEVSRRLASAKIFSSLLRFPVRKE